MAFGEAERHSPKFSLSPAAGGESHL